ncbi:interferon-inducible GTPase-domain-containing protein [Roridomyces roridus]|uniref:Interferon-inducible GTPase-domain-containing protein n=1 Tax=Roridomyces roridus TaxID=1738132 RepID=A0AAD7BBT4_9AGAR|nr:interferon-inducible GTPase-domain-containing protein [Roridomyces roridus]
MGGAQSHHQDEENRRRREHEEWQRAEADRRWHEAEMRKQEEEAQRRRHEAEMSAQREREAQAAMEAARQEAERQRWAAEAERLEAQRRAQEIREQAERELEEARQQAIRQQQLAEDERRRAWEAQCAAEEAAHMAAEEARVALESAEVERQEAELRQQQIREQGEREVEETRQEAERQQQITEEENRRALESQRDAEQAAEFAADQAGAALEATEEIARQLHEGIQPVVMPLPSEVEEAKRRIEYHDGFYHFAVAGKAGSGKSSLINALRGLRNRDPGAAETGIVETTLSIGRFPDANPESPIVWYDIPGAGTLKVPDWQYFNDQGLYVFDALVVLVDNRFTKTDLAIIRNARLFKIPCYIVRSKADVHIRNQMLDLGYESDDEEQDEEARQELEEAAKKIFIETTRQNVAENLRGADLPGQPVYIISNATIFSVVRQSITERMAKRMIDELEFLRNLVDGSARREEATGIATLML